MEKKSIRNSSVETLRIFFILGVVLIHIYGHGSHQNVQWIYSLGDNWSTAYQLSLFALGKMGVTGFMFISGLYGIKMTKQRWIYLLLMSITYFIALGLIFGYTKGLVSVVHAWDKWWFLSSYLLICLLSPLIELGFERLNKQSMQFLVAGLFIYTYVGHFMSMSNDHDVVILLTIYLIARYISIYPPHILRHSEYLAVISLLILAIMPILIQMILGSFIIQRMFLNNNNPLLVITAASMVLTAYKHPTYNRFVNWMAKSVLAIYLILEWPEIRELFNSYALPRVIEGWGLLLIPIVSFICILIESLRRFVFEKPTQFIINKILP